jgi:hypothetical protein
MRHQQLEVLPPRLEMEIEARRARREQGHPADD